VAVSNLELLRSLLEHSAILAENVDLRMAAPISSSRPQWQRNPVFKFFASLKLAVILLAVLIVAAIAGTIYESSFDAKVARAHAVHPQGRQLLARFSDRGW
jgi:hypothetical protein